MELVFVLIKITNCLPQLGQTFGSRIVGHPRLRLGKRRVDNRGRCRKVGITDGQVNHIIHLCRQCAHVSQNICSWLLVSLA